jgi:FkbM family methyltransferase
MFQRIARGTSQRWRGLNALLNSQYRRDSLDNQHLKLLIAFAVSVHMNCIDIGAYNGGVLSEIVRVAPHGRHIAYEPVPAFYKYLMERFPSIDVRNVAVSNRDGECDFAYLKSLPAYSGFHERIYATQGLERITVRTVTLDADLPPDYIPSLIKIDVEGAERLVIEGAIETISKYKPIVVFEHGKGGAEYYDTLPRHIYKLLHDRADLRIFDIDGNGPYTLGQFEEAYARNEFWNFVAHL